MSHPAAVKIADNVRTGADLKSLARRALEDRREVIRTVCNEAVDLVLQRIEACSARPSTTRVGAATPSSTPRPGSIEYEVARLRARGLDGASPSPIRLRKRSRRSSGPYSARASRPFTKSGRTGPPTLPDTAPAIARDQAAALRLKHREAAARADALARLDRRGRDPGR